MNFFNSEREREEKKKRKKKEEFTKEKRGSMMSCSRSCLTGLTSYLAIQLHL